MAKRGNGAQRDAMLAVQPRLHAERILEALDAQLLEMNRVAGVAIQARGQKMSFGWKEWQWIEPFLRESARERKRRISWDD